LPRFFGGVFATIKASSDRAFRELIGRIIGFYAEHLFNPHWGEQIVFRPGRVLAISMLFQGPGYEQFREVWQGFFDWLAGSPQDYGLESEPMNLVTLARQFWDLETLKHVPGVVLADDRPGAPAGNLFWAGNLEEAGQVLHAYQSARLPASLLEEHERERLADALYASSRHWSVSLHFNKELAGAPGAAIAAARETAAHPTVRDAFALAICGAEGPPEYPGIAGHEPDLERARRQAKAVDRAMGELRTLLPTRNSYLAEGDYFEQDWQ
jgi:hypothetical protein